MLDCSPINLRLEIEAAEQARERVVKASRDLVRLYATGQSDDGAVAAASGQTDSENIPHEVLSLYLPQLTFQNPRFHVTSRMPAEQRMIAFGHRHGLNRWSRDIGLADVLTPVCVDFLFSFGVVMTLLEDVPGYDGVAENVPARPNLYRISPGEFFMDPQARTIREARYMGHELFLDKQDLLDAAESGPDDGWNVEVIESLAEESEADSRDWLDRKAGDAVPERHRLRLYCVWVPEKSLRKGDLPDWWEDQNKPPAARDGYHGTVYTIAVQTPMTGDQEGQPTAKYVRQPQPYYGPPWGPYTVFGCYTIPDQPLPYSVLQVTKRQFERFNETAAVIDGGLADYKKGLIARTKDAADALIKNPHGSVFHAEGMNPEDFFPFEIGGITQQMAGQLAVTKERLDRALGMSNAVQGAPTPGVTATSDAIAHSANNDRMAWIKSRWMNGVTQVAKTASWFFHHAPSITFALGEEARQEMAGMIRQRLAAEGVDNDEIERGLTFYMQSRDSDMIFQGGDDDELYNTAGIPRPDGTWYDLEIEIDPFSMPRNDPMSLEKQAADAVLMATQVVPIIPTTPWFDWKGFFQEIGSLTNGIDLSQFIDQGQAGMAGEEMVQAAQAQDGRTDQATPAGNNDPRSRQTPGAIRAATKANVQSQQQRGR